MAAKGNSVCWSFRFERRQKSLIGICILSHRLKPEMQRWLSWKWIRIAKARRSIAVFLTGRQQILFEQREGLIHWCHEWMLTERSVVAALWLWQQQKGHERQCRFLISHCRSAKRSQLGCRHCIFHVENNQRLQCPSITIPWYFITQCVVLYCVIAIKIYYLQMRMNYYQTTVFTIILDWV